MKSGIVIFLFSIFVSSNVIAATMHNIGLFEHFKRETFKQDEQSFHDDHPLSSKPSEYIDFFEVNRRIVDDIAGVKPIVNGLKIKDGTERTYENEFFSSIQFMFGEKDESEDTVTYFVELVARDNGKAYYAYAILQKPDFVARADSPLNDFRVFNLYPVRGPIVFNLEERAMKGFSEIERLFEAEIDFISRTTVSRLGLLLPEWRPPDAVVAAISLKDAAEILNKVDDFNEEMSARPPYLFKGGSNDLINKTEPQLRASVLTPICRMIEQISGDSMNNGVAAINIQPYACVIESFGIMKVAIISANNIDCQPGRCDFSVRVHCRTQAGALREACRGINSGLSTMFGETNGVPVSVTFRPNGEVESLSASMR